jgi:flavin-dependent dehydrogenase
MYEVPEPRYGEVMQEWTVPIDTGEIPESGTHFDVIVVGGGPAGAAAASYNAFGGKSLSHVEELGVKKMVEATPHFRVDSIVFGSANGSEVRVMLPEEAFEKMQSGYALPRVQFDYMMFKRANELVLEGGGSVIQGFAVTEVLHEGEG